MSAETTPAVGALLKEYRLAAGLTQEALAERAGISVRGVQAIEGGINRPHPDTARRLADALGLVEDERARLLAVATPTPRHRAPTVGETRPLPLTVVRHRPSAPEGTPGGPRPALVPRNPYKGLRAFRAADAGDFFGRAALVADLVAAVQSCARPDAARFLAVVGPSGSGKSSVVLAGLLPHLRRGAVPGSADWVYLDPLLPGAHPLEALSIALATALPRSALTAIRADLEASERGLHLLAARLVSDPGTRVLLVVDQAEELFTLTTDEEERRQFIDLLVTAACEPRGPLLVLLTLRADFYDRPMRYSGLGRLVAAQSVAVLPLEPAELRAAIEGPAGLPDVGLRFEGDLVGDLLYEVREQVGALPLLQFTLEQLYERRAGDLLTEAAYRDLGGVRGALARHAEATYRGLPDDEHRHLARALFLRLIEPGASAQDTTRRRAALIELELADAARTARLRAVAEAFIAARLVTALESGGATTLEVSHEALIREWDRLEAWLHDAREDVRVQVRLSADAAAWQRHGRPIDSLYRGTVLTEAEGWAARNMPSAREEAFLAAAAAEERRQSEAEQARQARELAVAQRAAVANRQAATRLRVLVGMLAVFLAVAAGLTVFALNSRATAVADRTAAIAARNIALSRALAARAIADLDSRFDRALLLSVEANRTANTVEARDSLLRALEHDPALTTFLHGQTVWAIAFSANGTMLASGSGDKTIRLWDVARRQPLGPPLTGHTDGVDAVAFSPDGTILASGSNDKTIRLWDVAHRRPLGPPLTGHTDVVASVAFSPGGTILASCSNDNTIRLWDVAQRRPLGPPLSGHTSSVFTVAFSPDGTILASGSQDKTIRLWDVARRQPLGPPLTGHTDVVASVAFSPDGKTLASSSFDRIIRLWDVARRQQLGLPLTGHTDIVYAVAFSPDGKILASGSNDKTVRLWDLTRRQTLGQALASHTSYVNGVMFTPDGTLLVSGGNDGTIRLWDVVRRRVAGVLLAARTTGGPSPVRSVAVSPDGTMLAAGRDDGTVDVWDVARRQPRGSPLTGHRGAVRSVAFSPDGTLLATGSDDTTIRLWDVRRRQPLGPPLHSPPLGFDPDPIESVAFSPDGKLLASVSFDTVVRLWDVARRRSLGAPLGDQSAHHVPPVASSGHGVAFSPDGKILATAGGDNTIRLWDVARRQPLGAPLEGHADVAGSVAFSPDGTILASGSRDTTIRLWDVATGQPIGAPLSGHTDMVGSVAFSPDGTILASGSGDRTVRLWDINVESWERRACRIANRNLTLTEWTRYLVGVPYHRTCPARP